MASYKSITGTSVIPGTDAPGTVVASRTYRGISTVSDPSGSFALYDIALIKQDLLNHLHIRQGEKLENPEFGTIIWDLLFDPLTDETRDLIAKNVTTIANSDPRVQVDSLIVSQYESGIQIECQLTYVPYNVSEGLQFRFDQNNSILR